MKAKTRGQKKHLLNQWQNKDNREKDLSQTEEFYLSKSSSNGGKGSWHLSKSESLKGETFCGRKFTCCRAKKSKRKILPSQKPEELISFGSMCQTCQKKWDKEVQKK